MGAEERPVNKYYVGLKSIVHPTRQCWDNLNNFLFFIVMKDT